MINAFVDFLKNTPSEFHAIKNIVRDLEADGYERLQECAAWQLEKGKKYYVTRNLSSVIAFQVPENGFNNFLIAASHADSPVFKIKENAEIEVRSRYIQLNTERYGGLILSCWLDRPLSYAGRVLVKTESGIETRLVNLDEDSLVIPNVAIHMNREINNGYKYNPMSDMMPLYGTYAAKGTFKKQVAELAGTTEDRILGSDLFLYSRTAPSVWGPEKEFISAGRLDDIECAWTTAQALIKAKPTSGMPVLAVFDNEEVGSTTKQGGNSTFLTDVLTRVCNAFGFSREDYFRMQSSSFMLSCDNAHALHPNHPELCDAQNNTSMNGGIVLKESANQKYTSDGVSKALFRYILDNAGVPYQFFANRSDMLGGGTLGNIANTHYSLNTVDIGLAQLSMHSVWETAGVKDVTYMVDGVKAFFESDLKAAADGVYNFG